MSVNIRLARKSDDQAILELLKQLDLYYAGLELKDFWVAESNGQVIGTAQLEVFPDFCFLSSVGVKASEQKHGIGQAILTKLFNSCQEKKPVYLYTIIPNFFARFGFKPTTTLPAQIPTKERYECHECHPEKCVTMVRHAA